MVVLLLFWDICVCNGMKVVANHGKFKFYNPLHLWESEYLAWKERDSNWKLYVWIYKLFCL